MLIIKLSNKKEILKREKEQKDYLDKYEDYSLNLSLDESDSKEFSLDSLSFNEKKFIIKDDKKEEDKCKGLRDD